MAVSSHGSVYLCSSGPWPASFENDRVLASVQLILVDSRGFKTAWRHPPDTADPG